MTCETDKLSQVHELHAALSPFVGKKKCIYALMKIQKLLAAILLHSGSRQVQVYQVNIFNT